MKNIWILLIFTLTMVLASCGPSQSEEPQGVHPQNPKQAPTQEITPLDNPLPQPTQNEGPDFSSAPAGKFVDLSRNDLAKMLAVHADQISLLDTKEIIWPNDALGCPAPGKVYTTGKVPGYQIRFTANGQEYIYHTDLNGRVLLCASQNPEDRNPPGSTLDPNIGVPIQ